MRFEIQGKSKEKIAFNVELFLPLSKYNTGEIRTVHKVSMFVNGEFFSQVFIERFLNFRTVKRIKKAILKMIKEYNKTLTEEKEAGIEQELGKFIETISLEKLQYGYTRI